MKLSILIPTLESRRDQLYQLLNDILGFTPDSVDYEKCIKFAGGCSRSHFVGIEKDEIQIVFERDSGQKTVGQKRQELLEAATGDYIAFIDDDDEIAPDYISKILNAIETKPDCCSLTGELRWLNLGGKTQRFEHSLDHDAWCQKDGVFLRYPNHLNAVRRELALQVGFKDMRHGEDRDYSDRLKPLLKTEAKIDGVLYYYNCRG